MTGGELPSPEILSKILAAISPKDRRLMTDELNVTSPEAMNYSIAGTFWGPHLLCLSWRIHSGPDRGSPRRLSDLAESQAGPGYSAQRADLTHPIH